MKKHTVLFADDELHNIEALFAIAEAEGYSVKTCRNASEAVKMVEEGGVDCVVIDIMMDPGSNLSGADPHYAGLAAIDRILSAANHPPIICLSVISDQKIINSLKKKGVLYLRKAETSTNKAWDLIQSKITGVYRVKR